MKERSLPIKTIISINKFKDKMGRNAINEQ